MQPTDDNRPAAEEHSTYALIRSTKTDNYYAARLHEGTITSIVGSLTPDEIDTATADPSTLAAYADYYDDEDALDVGAIFARKPENFPVVTTYDPTAEPGDYDAQELDHDARIH